jgi:translation initiation factor IF-1
MSRDDLIQLEGAVSRVLGGGTLEIEGENNVLTEGVFYGRMKKCRLKVMKGSQSKEASPI